MGARTAVGLLGAALASLIGGCAAPAWWLQGLQAHAWTLAAQGLRATVCPAEPQAPAWALPWGQQADGDGADPAQPCCQRQPCAPHGACQSIAPARAGLGLRLDAQTLPSWWRGSC
ncbi:MAG: hypothetical protein N2690_01305 [Rhodocyclaceae bacterium]|nr:hypothetical protein [Rhodocyclaceae bacterium]